jgi:hypothetical protein
VKLCVPDTAECRVTFASVCPACQIVLSVARHAADPAVALVDDVDTVSDEGAVVMDPDQDVAVDACIAKSLGVGVPRLRMWECFPSECPAVMLAHLHLTR